MSQAGKYKDAVANLIAREGVIRFGSFELMPSRRLLLEAGAPVALGSRAFDLLLLLISCAGEVVPKEALLECAWPGIFVEEGTLRVHVAALRKALSDGQGEHRFIVNTPGRGYSFVAPLSHARQAPSSDRSVGHSEPQHDVPLAPSRMIGRDHSLETLALLLPARRFVTIVGPGGIGKTTLAVVTASTLRPHYADGVKLVNLAPVSDPSLAASVLASALGLTVGTSDIVEGIVRFLQAKAMLIVLDNCEHVIDAAALLAEVISVNAPKVHIIATSREALRASGEHVFRLPPLSTPVITSDLTAKDAGKFSSVELFVQRASANLGSFILTDAEAPSVGEICRRLDGNALAIELAASRLDMFGVRGVADQLDDRFQLLTRGLRTAMPHHQTLLATFDWSYSLLSKPSRTVLRRLGVLTGEFYLESACAIASIELSPDEVSDEVAKLLATSLLAVEVNGERPTYHLLESTRAYALDRLTESGELEVVSKRHAKYFLETLLKINSSYMTRTAQAAMNAYRPLLDNVRAALDWTLSAGKDVDTGISLTIAAAPLWSHLSLDHEWKQRSEAALAVLEPIATFPDRRVMQLSGALGTALLYTGGMSDEATGALTRALDIAEALGDTAYQLHALRELWSSSYNVGRFDAAKVFEAKFSMASAAAPALVDSLLAARMKGMAHFHRGELEKARSTIEEAFRSYLSSQDQLNLFRYQLDQRMVAGVILAKTLFLQGLPVQAERMAEVCLEAAEAADHDLSRMSALAYIGCRLPIITGDFAVAERRIEKLQTLLDLYPPNRFGLLAECWSGILLARKGNLSAALATLGTALERIPPGSIALHYTRFLGEHAHLLSCVGDFSQAMEEINTALRLSEAQEEQWLLPELLRFKGEIVLMSSADEGAEAAQALFDRSLRIANLQGALSWELRTAISIARFTAERGRKLEGHQLLQEVYSKFTEGFSTTDLKSARALLDG